MNTQPEQPRSAGHEQFQADCLTLAELVLRSVPRPRVEQPPDAIPALLDSQAQPMVG